MAVDCETCDPNLRKMGIGVRRGGYVAGISFAIEDGPSFYLPMRHKGGDNLPVDAVLRYVRKQAAEYEGIIVGANLPYDIQYLNAEDIWFPKVEFFRDVQIAEPLIYELHESFSLDSIAKRHGFEGKDETILQAAAKVYGVDAKGGMHKLPARFVGRYAEVDVEQPLKTLRKQEKLIDDLDLWKIYDLESRCLPALVRMTQRGVRIDMEHLRKVEEWSILEEKTALNIVKRETGYDIGLNNVYAAKAVAPALEAIGIRLHKTAKGLPNIDKVVLGSIEHPVAAAILHARKVNKLRTTFAESIRRYEINGRIHCTYNQMAREDDSGHNERVGVRYGRLSAVHPNLQQQPSRDDFANLWRKIYVPEEGCIFYSNDYSQQEPRWTTHFAAVMKLPKAEEAAQAYWDNPKIDNHQFMADLTGLPRKFAKNIYLGLCYGEGGAKLCRELGLPTRWAVRIGRSREIIYRETREEALQVRAQNGDGFMWEAAGLEGQQILDTFDERAPFIRKLAKAATKRAEAAGFVRTYGGRVLHFPQRDDGSYEWTHKALNRVIQGSSADQVKAAIVEVDRAGHFLQLQVHDELDGSARSLKEAMEVAEIMRHVAGETKVPFRVDVETGPSWGELKLAA